MGSTELMERFFLGGDYFCLGPSLVKCNSDDDNDGSGYVVNFLYDQQSCYFWALYVAPGGYHCVLNAPSDVTCWKCTDNVYGHIPWDFDGHPRCKRHEGIPIACEKLMISLANAEFEAWLAMRYFDGWCSMTLREEGRELPDDLLAYLDNYWPKK